MTEKYFLDKESLPFMFVPHDCVIADADVSTEYLTFIFAGNIRHCDSTNPILPARRSLIIRYHLIDETILAYKWKRNRWNREKSGYFVADAEDCKKWVKKNLQYINHHVAYRSIVIDLYADSEIELRLSVDFVEYEWN